MDFYSVQCLELITAFSNYTSVRHHGLLRDFKVHADKILWSFTRAATSGVKIHVTQEQLHLPTSIKINKLIQ